MKLSRTVSYAVKATLQLAQLSADGPVPCSKLASEGKMPERFLLQILRNLVTHGILRSTRGVDGGYALVRPADQISLLEVIEAIEGPVRFAAGSRRGAARRLAAQAARRAGPCDLNHPPPARSDQALAAPQAAARGEHKKHA